MNWFQRAALAINPEAVRILESAQVDRRELQDLRETITELQLDMEDQGYRLLVARSRTEFTRSGLDLIIEACRLFFLKNPLIRRGVKISSYYVFARGYDVRSDDENANAVLQEFFRDPRNACELGQAAMIESHDALQTDGNLFYCLFADKNDGSVLIRSIDAMEIREIICDPDDASVPWLYKRSWAQATFDIGTGVVNPQGVFAWYPALGYDPVEKPARIGDAAVYWDTPVIHHKDGALKKWRFGCPKIYPALDWAQAYKKLLTDYCQKAENLARFGYKGTTKGGQKSVNAVKDALQSTYAVGQQYSERNPAPQTGGMFLSGEGFNLEAIRTAGANSDPEEGRRVAHMIYNVFNLPETFFGDVSVGTLATATSLDRPTELAFRSEQESYEDLLTRIARHVLRVSKKAPNSKGRLREAKVDLTQVNVTVSFPAIIEQDIDKAMDSIVKAYTMNNKLGAAAGTLDPKTAMGMILNLLGVDDAQEKSDETYPKGYDSAAFAAIPPAEILASQPASGDASIPPPRPRSSKSLPVA